MNFDTSRLTRTSEKRSVPWRDTKLTFIWLRAEGPIVSAYKIVDKRHVFENLRQGDQVLAVRQQQYPTHQEVMVIDDLDAARQALTD
jgi:hypothetical protein